MRRTTIITCAVTLVAAAPAQAGSLTVFEGAETSHSTDKFRVTYTGYPGERNDVTATWDEAAQTYTLTDTGVTQLNRAPSATPDPTRIWPLSLLLPKSPPPPPPAGPSQCTINGQTAVCRPTDPYELAFFDLDLGDGDDIGRLDHGDDHGLLYGRLGNDVLTATSLAGGSAEMLGHGGDDVLTGGDGRDFLHGGFGADRLDGGGGLDRVLYRNEFDDPQTGEWDSSQNPTTGVSITLDGVANDGTPGESDNVIAGNDEIWATEFDDVIVGGPGTQVINAYPGDDDVDGGPGEDYLEGYSGNDVLRTRDGEADDYACGSENDLVLADAFDEFGVLPLPWGPGTPKPNDCETVEVE